MTTGQVSSKEVAVSAHYRIEIELVLPEAKAAEIVRRARLSYEARQGVDVIKDDQGRLISAQDFVPDVEGAFLELAEHAFCSTFPDCEPTAFRCKAVGKQSSSWR